MAIHYINNMNATSNDKVKVELDKIVNLFKSQDLPYKCAKVFISNGNKPSSKWSLSNKLIMLSNDSMDARGFNQWKQVDRYVKKGMHAFYILAPRLLTIKEMNEETKQEETRKIVKGFLAIPVFKYEDTEGKNLPEYEPKQLPPLMDIAQKLGFTVQYSDGGQYLGYYGSYDQNKTIALKTFDESTFFHELTHALDKHINGTTIKSKDSEEYALNEVVAELTSCVISELYGINKNSAKNYSYNYIKYYAAKVEQYGSDNEKVYRAILKVLGRVEKILAFIFPQEDKTQ